MSYLTDLRLALRAAFKAGSIIDEANVEWEGVDFTPPVEATWARESLMPVETKLASFPAANGMLREMHILQWSFFAPAGFGTAATEALAAATQALFKPGTTVMAGSIPAEVQTSEIEMPVKEKLWIGYPVSVRLMAHRANS